MTTHHPSLHLPTHPIPCDVQNRRGIAIALLVSPVVWAAPATARAQTAAPRLAALKASKSAAEALNLAAVGNPEPGKRVLLQTPDILVAGDLALIRVVSAMPGTDWIMLLAEGLPSPVIDVAEFTPGEGRALSGRVALTRSTRIRAIARSGGRYFSVSREIKVAAAGCPP